MCKVGSLGGSMSGRFFGKGCHLQKETSGEIEGLAVTVVQLVAALCNTAIFRPETWAGVFKIPRDWWWHRWVSGLTLMQGVED